VAKANTDKDAQDRRQCRVFCAYIRSFVREGNAVDFKSIIRSNPEYYEDVEEKNLIKYMKEELFGEGDEQFDEEFLKLYRSWDQRMLTTKYVKEAFRRFEGQQDMSARFITEYVNKWYKLSLTVWHVQKIINFDILRRRETQANLFQSKIFRGTSQYPDAWFWVIFSEMVWKGCRFVWIDSDLTVLIESEQELTNGLNENK